MPALPPIEDPRYLLHWLARPQVPIVLDTNGTEVAELHLQLSRLVARGGEKKRTRQSYFVGRAHPRPVACTMLRLGDEVVALANAGALRRAPGSPRASGQEDLWHALSRASAILWNASDDTAHERLSLLPLAKRFGVPVAIAWSTEDDRDLAAALAGAAYDSGRVVLDQPTAKRKPVPEKLLSHLLSLAPRPFLSDEPLLMLIATTRPWGLGSSQVLAHGVVLCGEPRAKAAVRVGTSRGEITTDLVEAPSPAVSTAPRTKVVLCVPHGSSVSWIVDAGASDERVEAVREIRRHLAERAFSRTRSL